jgi:hypothetical protein
LGVTQLASFLLFSSPPSSSSSFIIQVVDRIGQERDTISNQELASFKRKRTRGQTNNCSDPIPCVYLFCLGQGTRAISPISSYVPRERERENERGQVISKWTSKLRYQTFNPPCGCLSGLPIYLLNLPFTSYMSRR